MLLPADIYHKIEAMLYDDSDLSPQEMLAAANAQAEEWDDGTPQSPAPPQP